MNTYTAAANALRRIRRRVIDRHAAAINMIALREQAPYTDTVVIPDPPEKWLEVTYTDLTGTQHTEYLLTDSAEWYARELAVRSGRSAFAWRFLQKMFSAAGTVDYVAVFRPALTVESSRYTREGEYSALLEPLSPDPDDFNGTHR